MLPRILLLMELPGFGQSYSEIDIITDCYENLGNVHKNTEDLQLLSTIYEAPEESTVDPGTPEVSDTTSSEHLGSASTFEPRTQPSTSSAAQTTTGEAHEPPLSSSEVQNTAKTTVGQPTTIAPTTKNSDTTTTHPISPAKFVISTSDQPSKISPTAETLVPSTSSSTTEPPTKSSNTHSTTSIASLPEPTATPTTTTPKPADKTQCSDR